jgi:hypothetical protein
MDNAAELSTNSTSSSTLLLRNLVTKRPRNNRRVVTVSADKEAEVRLMPIVKDQRKVVLSLRLLLAIEDLVKHYKPHFIG